MLWWKKPIFIIILKNLNLLSMAKNLMSPTAAVFSVWQCSKKNTKKTLMHINNSHCFKQFNDIRRRGPQSPGEERKEDGGTLPFGYLFVCLPGCLFLMIVPRVFLLFRSGLCSLLRRPGSDSGATCWSDSQPTQHSIVLPVGYCHKGGEAWRGESNCVLWESKRATLVPNLYRAI